MAIRSGSRPLLAFVAVVGLLAGCGAPKYHYVKSSSDGVYFKVPHSWKVYDEDKYFGSSALDLSERQIADQKEGVWLVAFDGDPEPSIDNVVALVADHPTGVAQVLTASSELHDTASLKVLRNLLIDIDGGIEANTIRVIDYEEFTRDEFRGLRVVADVQTEEGTLTFDQTAYLNKDATKVFVLAMSCEAKCYEKNSDAIDGIAESWTLREQ